MPVFKGEVGDSTSVFSDVFNIPATIKSFYLYNNSITNNDVTISIYKDSPAEEIPLIFKRFIANESYSTSIPLLILPGYQIAIVSKESLFFYFTIE